MICGISKGSWGDGLGGDEGSSMAQPVWASSVCLTASGLVYIEHRSQLLGSPVLVTAHQRFLRKAAILGN